MASLAVNDEPRSWRPWIFALLATLLFHALLLMLHVDWGAFTPPKRMEVQQIDPKKIEAIRRQWKRERQQSLLLDKNKNAPKDKIAPKDARYFSDRNIRVEKEQRARETDVIPKPRENPQEAVKEDKPKNQPVPALGNLGVPFRLNDPPKKKQLARRDTFPGGDQAIEDKKLPAGAENLLNAQESIYYSFYARIYETVGPVWRSRVTSSMPQRKLAPIDYISQVEIVLDRDGKLLDIRWIRSCGVREFDNAIDYAFKKVAPLPNPPKGLINEDGEVRLQWSFNVVLSTPGVGFDYVPPPTRW